MYPHPEIVTVPVPLHQVTKCSHELCYMTLLNTVVVNTMYVKIGQHDVRRGREGDEYTKKGIVSVHGVCWNDCTNNSIVVGSNDLLIVQSEITIKSTVK